MERESDLLTRPFNQTPQAVTFCAKTAQNPLTCYAVDGGVSFTPFLSQFIN